MDFCSFFLSTTYVSDVAHKKHDMLFILFFLLSVFEKCVNLTQEVAVQFPTEKYYLVFFVVVVFLFLFYHYSGNWCKLQMQISKVRVYVETKMSSLFLWLYLSQCYISCVWRPRWPHCKLRVHLTGNSHDRSSLHANNISLFPLFKCHHFFVLFFPWVFAKVCAFFSGCGGSGVGGWLNCWAISNQIF